MSLFGIFDKRNKKDEYQTLYLDNGDDADFDYDDPDEWDDGFEEKQIQHKIKEFRGNLDTGDCPICGEPGGVSFENGIYICSRCGNGFSEDEYLRWQAGEPYEIVDEGAEAFDKIYDPAFTEDGDTVTCDNCGNSIYWDGDKYFCPVCGNTMERIDFFNHIGANPPGPKCSICDQLYPGCIDCPYGYIEEDVF